MQIHRSIFALAGALALGTAISAQAVPTASFFETFGDLDLNGSNTVTLPIIITPGSSFTVQFRLDTDAVPTIGFDYQLAVTELAGSRKIRLTGRDNTGSVFSEYFAENAIVLSGLNAVLDPSTVNLGASIIGAPLADGVYPVADLTLAFDLDLAPGLYTIGAPGATLTMDDSTPQASRSTRSRSKWCPSQATPHCSALDCWAC